MWLPACGCVSSLPLVKKRRLCFSAPVCCDGRMLTAAFLRHLGLPLPLCPEPFSLAACGVRSCCRIHPRPPGAGSAGWHQVPKMSPGEISEDGLLMKREECFAGGTCLGKRRPLGRTILCLKQEHAS